VLLIIKVKYRLILRDETDIEPARIELYDEHYVMIWSSVERNFNKYNNKVNIIKVLFVRINT